MFADVQVSLARIDPADPATWPNMAPQIRYLLLPVLMLPGLCFAAVLHPVLGRFFGPLRGCEPVSHVLIGLSYSAVLLGLPLGRVFPAQSTSLLLFGPAVALLSAIVVRWRFAGAAERPEGLPGPPVAQAHSAKSGANRFAGFQDRSD